MLPLELKYSVSKYLFQCPNTQYLTMTFLNYASVFLILGTVYVSLFADLCKWQMICHSDDNEDFKHLYFTRLFFGSRRTSVQNLVTTGKRFSC